MKYCILLAFIFFMMFFTGCSGFSCLPEINFVGKNREEVVRIFASNPTKTWGTHIHICTPLKNIPPYSCANNLYFKTVDEALADKRIQQAPALCLAIFENHPFLLHVRYKALYQLMLFRLFLALPL